MNVQEPLFPERGQIHFTMVKRANGNYPEPRKCTGPFHIVSPDEYVRKLARAKMNWRKSQVLIEVISLTHQSCSGVLGMRLVTEDGPK